jgi:1-acyl-sn-glycerol-3-phosphate acyltransferase
MNAIVKFLQWIYCVYAFILFVTIMLMLFPFVIIASFFGRIRGGNAIFRICRIWADLWFPLIFILPKRLYETAHNRSKPYIFVINHSSLLDAALLPKAFHQPVRPLGKVEMSRIPVFGFIYKKAIVTVDRGDADNRAQSIRILKSIIGKGISVAVFPEGTYNETKLPLKDFYNGAFRVAIETQTPLKPVLFLDANSRLHYQNVLSLNPGKCRLIFLDEVPVSGLKLRDTEDLKWKVYEIMERKLLEYRNDRESSGAKREVF